MNLSAKTEELYCVCDDTYDAGKEPLPIDSPELEKFIENLKKEIKETFGI